MAAPAEADEGVAAGMKVVETQIYEGHLTTESAEHRKQIGAGPEAATFSSPFGFSAGGGQFAGQQISATTPAALTIHTTTVYTAGPMPAYGTTVPPMQPQQPFGYTYQIQQTTVPYPMPSQGFPVPQPMPAGPPGHILEGWLKKRGHDFGQSWLNRWFVLHSDGVLTYGKEEKGPEKTRIPLDAVTEARPFGHPNATPEGRAMKSKHPLGFEVYQGPGKRTWFLDPGSIEKRDMWVRAINDMVMVQFRAPPGPPHGGTTGWMPSGQYM